jgi:Holliday junction DNA helicase RuvA
MIAYLHGKILYKNNNSLVIDIGNIGYRVFCNENYLNDVKIESIVQLYTYQHIREDVSELYGFKSPADLELFELLISISGVGPKTGLGVFSVAGASDIKAAISRGDSDLLTKVSGIGKKTAERIVLELRDKIVKLNFYDKTVDGETSVAGEEIDALMALGYSLAQAREALKNVDSGVTDSSQRIRTALRTLGK